MLPFLPPFLLGSTAQIREEAAAAVASIPVEAFSPRDLAEKSPIVVLIHLIKSLSPPEDAQGPPPLQTDTTSYEAIAVDVLKGGLSGRFILEIPAQLQLHPPWKISPSTYLAFLTQDARGRITLSSAESLKPYNRSSKQAYWPYRKWLPIEVISAEMESSPVSK